MTVIDTPSTLIGATMPGGTLHAGKTSSKILYDLTTQEHVCAACGHRAPTFHNILGHMSWKHRNPNAAKPGRPKGSGKTKPDLGARIEQVQTLLNEVRAEFVDINDEKVDATWKQRAQAAERRLSTLRRALGTEVQS